jgi:hypothetical protein
MRTSYKLKASIDNRTEVAARAWTGRHCRLLLATCLILVVRGGPGAAGRCLLRLLGRLLLQRLLVPGKKKRRSGNRIGTGSAASNRDLAMPENDRIKQKQTEQNRFN